MDPSTLHPAEENLWFVLMTLSAEGEKDAQKRNDQSRTAWRDFGYAPNYRTIEDKWRGYSPLVAADRTNWDVYERRFSKRNSDPEVKRPDAKEPIVLKGLRFDDPLNLASFAFRQHVTFEDCIFHQHVCLDSCLFFDGLTLRNVHFHKGLSFKGAGCRGRFQIQDVRAFRSVSFEGSRFGGSFDCTGFAFEIEGKEGTNHQISCKDVCFDGFTQCADETFSGYAIFEGATFKGRAMFSRTKFEQGLSFRGAVFRDYAYFNRTTFVAAPNTKTRHINFTESRFERPPTFRHASFKGEYPNLAGAILHDRTVFTIHEESWPTHDTLSQRRPDAPVTSAAVASEIAAILRALSAKQSLPEEEHFFFRCEMHHAARAKPFWTTGHIYLFEALSDFGHSIARSAILLLALWLLGAMVFSEATKFGLFQSLGYSSA